CGAARLPTPAAAHQPGYHEQQHRADGRVEDLTEDAGGEPNAELGKQPAGDERADEADGDVAEQSVAGSLHELAGQPAGNQTYQQNDKNAFARHDLNSPALAPTPIDRACRQSMQFSAPRLAGPRGRPCRPTWNHYVQFEVRFCVSSAPTRPSSGRAKD